MMASARAAGFWSYVQADDAADGGRIIALARTIEAQYEMLTATKLELFVDRDSLAWGDEWKKRIDEAIAGTTFFIPIITPRYFESEQCRRELVRFTGKARSLGLEELLLPVYWINVPGLSEEIPEDDALRLIKQTQWEDWRQHRLADASDAVVRQAVQHMAERLASISDLVARVPDRVKITGEQAPGTPEEDRPGVIDLLATGEEAFPRMTEAANAIGTELEAVGMLAERASAKFETADIRAGFAGRLKIARDLARDLDPHAQRIEELGRRYGTALVDTDPAIQTLLRQIEEALEGEPGETLKGEERQAAVEFVSTMKEVGASASEAITELKGMLAGLEDLAGLSRDIRRPSNQMKRGLQGLVDGQAVIDGWATQAADVEPLLSDDESDPHKPEDPPSTDL